VFCLEGTNINSRRGTEIQFQVFWSPNLPREQTYQFSYTPVPNFGAKSPKIFKWRDAYGLWFDEQAILGEIKFELVESMPYNASDSKGRLYKASISFLIDSVVLSIEKANLVEGAFFWRDIKVLGRTGFSVLKNIRLSILIYWNKKITEILNVAIANRVIQQIMALKGKILLNLVPTFHILCLLISHEHFSSKRRFTIYITHVEYESVQRDEIVFGCCSLLRRKVVLYLPLICSWV